MATPVNPPAQLPTFVVFSSEVSPQTTQSLMAVMANLSNMGIAEVHFVASTPGGGVAEGLALYNFLRGLPLKLVTHNVGSVNSIGNVVFLAGAERYACPQSTFMFHGVGFDSPVGQHWNKKFLRERLDGILHDEERIGKVIEDNGSLDAAVIADLFKEMQTKDAAYAVSAGIVHEIRDVRIPTGAPIQSLVFQR